MYNKQKFEEIYDNLVNENIFQLEELRKKALHEKNRKSVSLVSVIILFIILSIITMTFPFFLISFIDVSSIHIVIIFQSLLMIGLFLAFSIIIFRKFTSKKSKNRTAMDIYQETYKEKIITPLIQSFNRNLQYEPNSGLDKELFINGEFIPWYSSNLYHSNDLVYGLLSNNCKFNMAEVFIKHLYTDSYGYQSETPIFNGLFAFIETNSSFKDRLYITKNSSYDNKESLYERRENYYNIKSKIDSTEFEKIFDVYSNSQIISLQILTHEVIEMILDFYNEFKVNFEITIKEKFIYIRFSTYDMFEVPFSNKYSLDKDTLYKYYRTLDFTLSLSTKLSDLMNNLVI